MKPSKRDLEDTIKEKVAPLLDETMEKSWGFTIPKVGSDITDQLKEAHLSIYIPLDLSFQEAKKFFKKEFLKKELKIHLGNISQLAKTLGLDRRSIHRTIKDLEINVNELREERDTLERSQEELINQTIKRSLEHYKGIIQKEKMAKMYEALPNLSRNIAKFIPHQDWTWKEAEKEFEKQFFKHALKQNQGKISETAHQIGIRIETLHRKVKRLELDRNNL